ncbi:MAG: Rne/Rng family ribonuclease [Bacteroidales bacterium]|nr:Rne/Rng family ribonuclease [Bacteroidales bacterium]
MSNELIISVSKRDISIAYTENKRLSELHKEKSSNKFTVGDIFLAKVKKVMNGLNAAFVDVGFKKDAFLHYFDLGPQFDSQQKFINTALNSKSSNVKLQDFKLQKDINKYGKISEVLKGGQIVLVQIAKEPISTKGPRLSAEISIAGRNLVLIPFSNTVSISKKIVAEEERKRLKRLIQSIKPENFGVIVRTVAKNRRVAVLDEELRELVKKWEGTVSKLQEINPPSVAMGELNKPAALLRDILNNSFTSIYVDSESVYSQMKNYVSEIFPDKEKIVKYYDKRTPIFDYFGISKQIKASFGKTVTIQSGAYLIIEETEALTVVDVNSGNRSKKASDQETNAVEVNMLAAEEIARQLRLRDIGGIIVVDFIDMHSGENKQKLFQYMKEAMATDRTKHSILPLSKFGLMQITRQRVRPATDIETKETCPTCEGTGEITPSIIFADEVENHLQYMISKYKGAIELHVHPFIAGYLRYGFKSKLRKWILKYKRKIKIVSVVTYNYLEYRFYNKEGDELKP